MPHHWPPLLPILLLSHSGKHILCVTFFSSLFLLSIITMALSFSYWNDCVTPHDMEAMWKIHDVRHEWLEAGEERGQKVHISRDPDGQPYLTQTEMRAVARIVVRRHFHSEIDYKMICAIAELESDRQLLATRYNKKSKEPSLGLMQLQMRTVEWLIRELGYRSYATQENFLFQPFINVYFGAAYIRWLSHFGNKERNEEFIVRAYKGGTKKAAHKSTLPFWKSYLAVKESFPSRKSVDESSLMINDHPHAHSRTKSLGPLPTNVTEENVDIYWDTRASKEDMVDMWKHPEVRKKWNHAKQKRGSVNYSVDENKRPFLSRVELQAVADIVLCKHFITKKIKSTVVCAIAEVSSTGLLYGVEHRPGIMGINYSTASWIYKELGYNAYEIESDEDLYNPFASMYFGAAYIAWLSEYDGRDRTTEFVVQAYFEGPKKVNLQDTSTIWLKFEEALSTYKEGTRRHSETCNIMYTEGCSIM